MSDSDTSNGPVTPFQLIDLLTDLCSGILMIFLFGPFLYVAHYPLNATLGQLLFGIFPDFFGLFKTLSLTNIGPYLLLGLALLVGFVSRAVLVIPNLLPLKWLERFLARIAYIRLIRWHGLGVDWNYDRVLSDVINRNPFHEVGDAGYANYRALLEEPGSPIRKFKSYWDYEAGLYIRYQLLYGIFYAFSLVYLVYGAVINTIKGPHFPETIRWLGLVALFLAMTVCLLNEVIVHAAAFIAVDQLLRQRIGKESAHV